MLIPALAIVPGTTAAAKENPYRAAEVCGAGYSPIDRHHLRDMGKHLADLVLLYNPSTGNNCAVTMKKRRIGKRDWTYTALWTRTPGEIDNDKGDFKYFSGPVYVHAPGQCVTWQGGGEQIWRYQHNTFRLQSSFKSRWSHCG